MVKSLPIRPTPDKSLPCPHFSGTVNYVSALLWFFYFLDRSWSGISWTIMCVAFYLYLCGHYSNTGPCIAQHTDVARCPKAHYTLPVNYKCRDCSLSEYMDHYYPERVAMRSAHTHLRHSRDALLKSLETDSTFDVSSPSLRYRSKGFRGDSGPPISYYNRQHPSRYPVYEPAMPRPQAYYPTNGYVASPPPPPLYENRQRRKERRPSPLRDAFARDAQRRPYPQEDPMIGAQLHPPPPPHYPPKKHRSMEPSFSKRTFSKNPGPDVPRKTRRATMESWAPSRDRSSRERPPSSYRDSIFDPLRTNPAGLDYPLSMLRVPSCSKTSRRYGVVFG